MLPPSANGPKQAKILPYERLRAQIMLAGRCRFEYIYSKQTTKSLFIDGRCRLDIEFPNDDDGASLFSGRIYNKFYQAFLTGRFNNFYCSCRILQASWYSTLSYKTASSSNNSSSSCCCCCCCCCCPSCCPGFLCLSTASPTLRG